MPRFWRFGQAKSLDTAAASAKLSLSTTTTMPLVPTATYSAWYSKKSWVYHHFSYLFDNPLWEKSVPQGFSLCPYFWLALFSLAIFRPFVYLLLTLRWACQTARLNALIRWTDKLAVKTLGGDPNAPFMLPTAVAGSFAFMAGAISFAVYTLVTDLFSVGMLIPGGAALLNVGVLLICWIYYSHTLHDSDRCRVEWYVRGSLALTLILAFAFHTALFVEAFVGIPWAVVSTIGGLLAGGLSLIWNAFTWLLLGAISMSWVALAALATFGAFLLAGYLIERHLGVSTKSRDERKTRKEEAAWLRAVYNANLKRIQESLYSWLTYDEYDNDIVWAKTPLIPFVDTLARTPRVLTSEDITAHKDDLLRVYRDYVAVIEARKTARSAACKRTTELFAKICAPFTWAGRQAAIMGSYLWAFTKAKKAGVCPYLKFHD